jgi:molybdate transport system substrate-binding protein
MSRIIEIIMVISVTAGIGCTTTSSLTVYAASSLTEAFTEISAAFEEKHPGLSVTLNFAGSQQLRTQLQHGAKADVFATADPNQMEVAIASNLILGLPTNFASNRVVVIVPLERKLEKHADDPINDKTDDSVKNLHDLAHKGIKLVIALPEVPIGRYGRIVLEKMEADPLFGRGYAELVLANIVSQEFNVRHVVQKVALGEADAGIVYWTDATAAPLSIKLKMIPIPDRLNVIASYSVAQLKETQQPELSDAFIKFVQSEPSQQILRTHRFGPAVRYTVPSLLIRADLPLLSMDRLEPNGSGPIPIIHHHGSRSDAP